MQFIRAHLVRIVAVVGACGLIAVMFAAQNARAATTFTVNTTADTVDAGGCTTATVCSLRDAVIAADNAGGGTISVPAGTYTLSIASSGETGDPTTGDLDIDNGANVTIAGAGAASTVIDPDQIDRAFSVAAGATLDLSDVTIENGSANTGLDYGGAIYSDGTLSVSDSILDHDNAESGGDIYVDTDALSTTIADSTLSNSFAGNTDEDSGGAVGLEGGSLTVTDSTFSNDSTDGDAGAIEAAAGDVTITDSTFSGDSAGENGGALEINSSPTTITASTFSDDTSEGFFCGSSGGAIVDDANGGLDISSSLFSGNSADLAGGGIAYGDSGCSIDEAREFTPATSPAASPATPAAGSLTITDSEITGSAAVDGAGLNLSAFGTVDIENTTIDHNTAADGEGGGINVDGIDSATITDTTISDNDAGSGAGIYFDDPAEADAGDGPIQFTNDTIAGNTSGNNGSGANGAGIYDPSDASDGTSGGFVNTIVADNVGGDCNNDGSIGSADEGNNLDTDGSCFPSGDEGAGIRPADETTGAGLDLGPLADNGGPQVGAPGASSALLTQLPGASSSAIDAGSTTACPATDERGTPSPYEGGCDVGAVEVAPAALSITDSAASTATTGVPFDDTVTVSDAGPAPSGQTVLTFTIPTGETVYGADPAQGTCSTSASTVTCDLGDVLSGNSTTVTLVVAGTTPGSYTNPVAATNVEAADATGSATTQVTAASGAPVNSTTTLSSTTTVTVATTTPTKPAAVTGAASKPALTSARVNGEVTTGGVSTTYFFEYGKTTRYGLVTPVTSTTANEAVSHTLTNLTAGTTYHYRLVAVNAEGQSVGKDRAFRTAGTHYLGDLLLDSSTLAVSGGRVRARFTCDSSITCVFRWSVTTQAEIGSTGNEGPVLVTSGANPPVEIAAHGTRTISYRATEAGLALLAQHGGRLNGRLTSRPLSHQGGLIRVVHLR